MNSKPLKVNKTGFQLLFHLRDGFKDAKRKLSAYYRGHLHYSLEALLQTVHASSYDPLNSVGTWTLETSLVKDKLIILFLDRAILE